MQHKMFFPRRIFAAFAVLAFLALAACGGPAAPKPAAVSNSAPANPPTQAGNPPTAQNNPSSAQPTPLPGASGEAVKPGGEGAPGAEGAGRPEGGASVASVTDPGGLPPSPQTKDPTLTYLGQEQMVVYRNPSARYQVLFVNSWTTSAGNPPGSVTSAFRDRHAQIDAVSSGGKNALAFATADEASVKAATPGYQRLALKPEQLPPGSVASLIYRYQTGQNPVTGKALDFIAARVYVPRPGSNDLAIITVTAPANFYGDLTQIFDTIVASFKWI